MLDTHEKAVRELANLQRAEAKALFQSVLNVPNGFASIAADRMVDCIIGAAILEMAAIQEAATRPAKRPT